MRNLYKLSFICLIICITCLMGFNAGGAPVAYAAGNADFYNDGYEPDFADYSGFTNNVVLVAFNDELDYLQTNAFDELLDNLEGKFNEDDKSLYNYYRVMSNGKFELKTTFLKEGSQYFVVELPYARGHYLPYSSSNPLGYSSTNANQVQNEMLQEIFTQLDESEVTFVDSDVNNDNQIDSLSIVYLNEGKYRQEMSKENDGFLWPHKGTSMGGPAAVIDGLEIHSYSLVNSDSFDSETASVMSHEMGHILGLPDLYEVNQEGIQAVGDWDNMAYDKMQYLTTFDRYMLGWLDDDEFVELTYDGEFTIAPTSRNESRILNGTPVESYPLGYYLRDDEYPNQLICFEYRDRVNSIFDASLFESGLLVYRVDLNTRASVEVNRFVGNYYSDGPYSVYMFRKGSNVFDAALNNGESLGANDVALYADVTANANNYITYQVYDHSLNVDEIINDVTYVNSGIVISNVNISGGRLTFELNSPLFQSDFALTDTDIPDAKLRTALYAKVGKVAGDELYRSDFANVNEFNLAGLGITNLKGLELLDLSSLKTLILNNNKILNGIEVIGGIRSLENLQLFDCGIDTIGFASSLTNLKYINVACNKISDFGALKNLPIEKGLLALNDLEYLNSNNAYLYVPQSRFIVGLQNVTQEILISAGNVYYSSRNLEGNVIFGLKRDGMNCVFNGDNTLFKLESGTYQLSFEVEESMIEYFGDCEKGLVFKVYNVTVKTPLVELRQGRDTYIPDNQDSLNGFAGTGLTLVITTSFNDGEPQLGAVVDVDVYGKYVINFEISYGTTKVVLTKTVLVHQDFAIPNNASGIPDQNLYKELLTLVNKSPELIGQGEMGTLYFLDIYFYNLEHPEEPITTLNLRKKNIASVQGIHLIVLDGITKIVLNSNKITDISPLYRLHCDTLNELHIADNKIESIEGFDQTSVFNHLQVLDISYNYISDVSPLKALTDINTLKTEGKQQYLQKVNLMFNLIDVNAESNQFITSASTSEGYLSAVRIYIILVQGIKDGDVYINSSKFQYVDTLANTYYDSISEKDLPMYYIKVNGANNKFNGLTDLITNSALISGKKYTLSVGVNKRGFDLQINESDSRFERYCYVINASLNELQPNHNAGTNSLLLIEDMSNTILTTESIILPDVTDVKLGVVSGVTIVTNLNCDYKTNADGKTFVNGVRGTYQIEYVIQVMNAIDGTTESDKVSIIRTITVLENNRVIVYGTNEVSDVEQFSEFLDENLYNKLCDILNLEPKYYNSNGKDRPFLYQYDTYNLTDLNLAESNIEYVNGLGQLKLNKLKYLRINKNKIKSVASLVRSTTLKNLVVLDISENFITDSSPLNQLTSTAETFYINACVNQFDLTNANNRWLVYESTSNVKVLSGIQCLEKESVAVTFREVINSANDGNAGFFYCTANMGDGGTLNAKDAYVDAYDITSSYYPYNFYYYYKDAGVFNVTFTYSLSHQYQQVANIQYSATLRHGKVYQSATSVDVDYEKENSQFTRDRIASQLDMVFEEIAVSEYDVQSYINSFKLNVLATYTQNITVSLKEDASFNYLFTKSVVVKDREKPRIIFNGEPYVVVLKGLGNGYDYRGNGIGRGENSEVYVKDNYTAPVTIIATIYNSLGTEVPQVDINTPDTYTVKYNAKDSYNNVADEVVRTVKVIYNDYASGVRLVDPDAEFMVGEVELSASIMVFEDEEDLVNPIPTFYWFIDGVYVGESKSSQTLDESSILRTTFKCVITEAGKHEITLRVNNKDGRPDEENAMAYTTSIFVLLDEQVIKTIVIVVVVIIALVVVTLIIIFALIRRRNRKINNYDYNILKESEDDKERSSRAQR